jgi:O-antigen/teichoic acid export membrane protein
MILIIAVGLLFSSFDTIELWFQSQVLEGILALVRSALLIVSSFAKVLLIAFHLPLIAFVWLLLADQVVKTLGMIWVYLRQHQSILDWKVNGSKGLEMLKDSWPLILASAMITIYMKIDQVMLGQMANAQAVGNYAAAARFSEIWYFIPLAVCSSVFPAILRARQRSKEEYYARLQQLYDLMAWISLAITIPMTIFSVPLMVTLLGKEYAEAGRILALHIWSAPFVFLGVAQGRWLAAENFTRVSLAKTLLGAMSNVLLNLLLIPYYGGVGAAIATMISYGISSHLSNLFYPPLFDNGWMITKALLIPLRIRQNLFYLSQVKKLGWNSQRSN